MRRSATAAILLGAAATAAVLGAAAPFAGQMISAAGTAAGAVLDGPSSSPPSAAVKVQAAPASTALPPVPHVNGATNLGLINCSKQRCTSLPGAGPSGGTCGRVVNGEQFCVWGQLAAALWSCTIMSDGGTLEIRAGLSSGYAKSVTVNFSDNEQGHIFPPVTYPVNESAPYTLWEDVPPGDIGASAEPAACTAG